MAGFFLGILGCQLRTQESVPETAPLKLSGPAENCFGESLKTFETYFRSESEPVKIDAAFECVSGALELFSTYGRGSVDRESFSSKELRAFLERYFLGSLKLNDALLGEFFRIKQALLGGSADRLTKPEIERLTQVLETLRVEAQRLRPYVGILTQSRPVDSVDANLLEQALSDFSFSMQTFGALLEQSKQTYYLENLKTLLIEIQQLYAGRSNWKGPEWFAKQTPLLAAAKALLIRPQGAAIEPDEWGLLFSHVGRIYGLFLRFEYTIRGRDLFYGEALQQFETSVLQATDILHDAILAKGTGRIDLNLLRVFVDELGKVQTFKLPIQASTISGLFEPLLERVFNPVVTGEMASEKLDPSDRLSVNGYREVQGGLTLVNLERLRDTLLSWVEMQNLWDRLERDAYRSDASLRGQPIPLRTVRKFWAGYTPQHQEAWGDLKALFDRAQPPMIWPDGRLMLARPKDIVVDRNSFAGMNWKQQIIRGLGHGYVSDPVGLRMKGITQSQLKTVFDDFRLLTVDLKFVDPLDFDIWKTGFTISNIFLASSNGDDRLGYHEAVDLFVFSFAAGVVSKQMVRTDVYANCENGDLNSGGNPRIIASCWRSRLRAGYEGFFEKMPAWANMSKAWTDAEWNGFFADLEKASRKPTNPNGPLAASEMDRPVTIHHYIESLYRRWDSNADGQLSFIEADKSYYLFRQILQKASGFSKDEEVRALFFYLLTFGKPPESFSEKLYWLWWKKAPPEEWEKRVMADRRVLTQIFGNLASQL